MEQVLLSVSELTLSGTGSVRSIQDVLQAERRTLPVLLHKDPGLWWCLHHVGGLFSRWGYPSLPQTDWTCSVSEQTVWQNLTVADPDSTSYILIPRVQFSSTNLNLRTLNTFVSSGLHGECYKDNPSRLLPAQQQVGPVTVEKCYSRCASKGRSQPKHDTSAWSWAGYKYAGLQNGSQCFCGSISPPTSALVSLSQCSKPCQGDPGQKCGASWRMNVYLIKTNWKYIRPQENRSLIILLFQLKTKTTNSFHINNSINQFHNTFFFSDGCSALQHLFCLNFGRKGLPSSREPPSCSLEHGECYSLFILWL